MAIVFLIFQLLVALLYATLVNYPSTAAEAASVFTANSQTTLNVAVMVLVGFGLLLTHLRSASFSGAAFSLFVVVVTLQYYILWSFLWSSVTNNQFNRYATITQLNLTKAFFASASVLVSYGAMVGRLGPFEIFLMVLVEVIGYSLNEMLCTSSSFLQCYDVGGGMQIFTYGAVFAVTVILFLSKEGLKDNEKKASGYVSTLLNFLGTLFLWVYWPSFTAASAMNTTDVTVKEVAATNTVFALIASTMAAFVFSLLYNTKLQPRDISFASLSGAVAIASGADLVINIGGVMLIAFFVGWISASGYNYFHRYLELYGFYDSSGTVSLFLLPGVLSGLFSGVLAAAYTAAPKYLPIATVYAGRTAYEQGAFQVACLATSVGIAVVCGILAGLLLRKFAVYYKEDLFDDRTFWEVPFVEDELPPTPANRRAQRYVLELTNRLDEAFVRSPLVL